MSFKTVALEAGISEDQYENLEQALIKFAELTSRNIEGDALLKTAKCVISLWDDPCPYDANTTKGVFPTRDHGV